ncbi:MULTISPECIES: hypothetical protein [Peribacillus]|uniref:hypothetical protein n=1 Tax=Peribacillus TaxID=2675229 RepID=UPI001F4DAF9D|nr:MULTISPECIES: hypothetical protein [unclassified Peribacillus]MCK1985657.1 hypothetical protein [Peribacillus sp. Aquil_B1]MCK2009326.1 hypothetical protein [Peribacillus sp. Aquil_B8]
MTTSDVQYLRSGLRVRCEKDVNPSVRRTCLSFAVWLRTYMEFPVRVVVYLKTDYQLKTRDTRELASATFFAPYDKTVEPYIRIATGDYEELVSERGKNDALWAILRSMAHEIIHYQQWLEDKEMDEKEAENGSEELLDSYYEFL